MSRSRLVLAAVIALTGLACARRVTPARDVEREILALEDQRRDAQRRGDWQTIQSLNAPDFSEIAGTGLIRTAAQNADDMRSGRLKFERVEYTERQVRLLGDAAVVTGLGHRTGSFDGTPFEQRFRYSRVYARRGGAWRVVFAQTTRLGEGAR